MKVRFVAGVSPIVDDSGEARRFYGEQLGLPVTPLEGSDYSQASIEGVKHFGLWTLRDAARSVFDKDDWPAGVPRPQATIEFEVDDVPGAVEELSEKGLTLLQGTKAEPWGQTTARLLSPEGLLIGVVSTPWLREEEEKT
jgi:catechol 2,3-dioxygenase-like lactoylglutathione lyase family enzyme